MKKQNFLSWSTRQKIGAWCEVLLAQKVLHFHVSLKERNHVGTRLNWDLKKLMSHLIFWPWLTYKGVIHLNGKHILCRLIWCIEYLHRPNDSLTHFWQAAECTNFCRFLCLHFICLATAIVYKMLKISASKVLKWPININPPEPCFGFFFTNYCQPVSAKLRQVSVHTEHYCCTSSKLWKVSEKALLKDPVPMVCGTHMCNEICQFEIFFSTVLKLHFFPIIIFLLSKN